MPKHVIRVTLNCDHPDFTDEEAVEFVDEHLAVATARHTAHMLNMSTLGHILVDGGNDVAKVEWEVGW